MIHRLNQRALCTFVNDGLPCRPGDITTLLTLSSSERSRRGIWTMSLASPISEHCAGYMALVSRLSSSETTRTCERR